MIDLKTMNFGVLFVGSSLEFLIDLQKSAHHHCFNRHHHSQKQRLEEK